MAPLAYDELNNHFSPEGSQSLGTLEQALQRLQRELEEQRALGQRGMCCSPPPHTFDVVLKKRGSETVQKLCHPEAAVECKWTELSPCPLPLPGVCARPECGNKKEKRTGEWSGVVWWHFFALFQLS